MAEQSKPTASPEAAHRSRADVEATAAGDAQVEQALTPGEWKFRRLFESNIVGIIVADVHGRITEANDFFLLLLGYTRDELPLRWDLITPPEWRALDQAKITEVLTTGASVPWEKEYFARDGRRVPILIAVALLEETDGVCIGVVRDLSKRKEDEQRLAEHKEQLQALATELVLAGERERRRIARGLHDGIGHTLATARMKLCVLREAKGSAAVEASVEAILTLLDQAIEAARSLTFELTSPVLYELGLVAAVKSLGKQVAAQHGLRFHFETHGPPKPMPESTSVVLYHAARELLFNVVKHARAQNVWMWVERDRERLCLTLTDDGVGFDAARIGEGFDQAGGFGLFNVRQQLDYIGGRVEIDAALGTGTRVVVVMPLA